MLPVSVRCQDSAATADARRVLSSLLSAGMKERGAYALLRELTREAPHRLSGSQGAARAVRLVQRMMDSLGFANVHREDIAVPHWERGAAERCTIVRSGARGIRLSVCALGGSVGTQTGGITAEVLEVRSFEELARAGDTARGKIIFFNRPMDASLVNTFEAYGGAVDQRFGGAAEAAKAGGVAALVRSMTLADDDVPHTGVMGYRDGVRKIPTAALGARSADRLSAMLHRSAMVTVRLVLRCQTLPDAPSANVVGEIAGSVHPENVIVISGHLDCWDKGEGAHDDGAGCVQALEALRLLQAAGVRPHQSIRVVLYMNEENGSRGGKGYAQDPRREKENHVALMESDRGGFAPRGFTVDGDSSLLSRVMRWQSLFDAVGAGTITQGGGGADISPMAQKGIPCFGLLPENQRYFDYHHSDNDTLDKVNPRELELGAIIEALLAYLLSESKV